MSHTQPLCGTLNWNNSSTKPCLFLGKWGKDASQQFCRSDPGAMAFFAANSRVKSPKSPLWIPSATGVAHPIVAEHPYPQWSDRRRSLELTSSIQPVAGQTDCCQLPRPTLLWNRQKEKTIQARGLEAENTYQPNLSVYIYILHTWLYLVVISVISLYIFLTVPFSLPSCRRFIPAMQQGTHHTPSRLKHWHLHRPLASELVWCRWPGRKSAGHSWNESGSMEPHISVLLIQRMNHPEIFRGTRCDTYPTVGSRQIIFPIGHGSPCDPRSAVFVRQTVKSSCPNHPVPLKKNT